MKKATIVYLLIFITVTTSAQTTASSYKIKAELIYGNIFNHDPKYVGPLILNPITGTEFALEFQTQGEKAWHNYLNFPIIGIGASWLNLGNAEKLGNAFALYPYIDYPLWRTKHFTINIKAGAGISFLTKNYYNTNTDSLGNTLPSLVGTNAAIGSVVNVYFSGGGNIEIPIGKGLSFTADYTWNHMSNGSIIAPNTGLNLLNGFVGVKYSPNYNKFTLPQKLPIKSLPQKFTTEIIVSGGVRQLYYKDNYLNSIPSKNPQLKLYPIASICLSIFRPLSNVYRMGLGVDAFYDGVYDGHEVLFMRTYLQTNEFRNKIRMGVSWQHELMMGKLTAGFHLGLYLFNPIKNLEPYVAAKKEALNKPLIYAYNIDTEDGWLYTRASLKYALSKHIFASIGLKTHLQKAEFIEWGLGYRF
jgi:hypothetical protein